MRTSLFDRSILATAQQAVEFVSNILEASTEYSVIGKDLDGKILLWNEGARRMYGYEAEEVVGKLNSDVLHTPEDVAAGIITAADSKRDRGLSHARPTVQNLRSRPVAARKDSPHEPPGHVHWGTFSWRRSSSHW